MHTSIMNIMINVSIKKRKINYITNLLVLAAFIQYLFKLRMFVHMFKHKLHIRASKNKKVKILLAYFNITIYTGMDTWKTYFITKCAAQYASENFIPSATCGARGGKFCGIIIIVVILYIAAIIWLLFIRLKIWFVKSSV